MALSISLCIILIVVTLDQVTKVFLMDTKCTIIEGLLKIEPRYNDGAAFSSLRGARVFFIIFTVIALFIMLYILICGKFSKNKLFRSMLALLIGGTIGNFIDRFFIGAVRDFIYIPPFKFVCNIADIAITASCVLLVIYLFFIRDKEEAKLKQQKKEKEEEGSA